MVRRVAVLVNLTAVLLGCGGPTPPDDGDVHPPGDGGTRLMAEATTIRLRLGEALTLPVSAVDELGNQVSLSGATFETNGRLVANVGDLGLVSALEPGSDTVVVKLDGDSVAIEILVEYPEGITHPDGTVVATTTLENRPFGIAVGPNGDVLVTQLDASTVARGTLPATSLSTRIPVGNVPTDVTVDGTGTLAYVTNQHSSNIGVIDLTTDTQVATIEVSGDPFRVKLSPDGHSLFVTGNADSLFIVDVPSREIRARLAIGLDANGLALDYTGTRLYVSNQSDGTVSEVDLSTNTVLRSITVGGHPQELVLSPGGTLLFVADESGSVQVWSLREGTKRASINVPGGAFAMAVSPDWRQLYISSALGGAVYLIDWKTGVSLKQVTTGGMPRRIGFAPDGTTAVVANEGGWVDYIR
jgi:YVTN family beta-propeller protein